MAARTPQNSVQNRKTNMRMLLKCILDNAPVSKRDLQAITGLSWGAVSSIVSVLCDNGYVVVTDKQDTNVGRKPFMLDINTNAYYVIGVDLNRSGLYGVVTDIRGRIVREWRRIFTRKTMDCVIETTLSLLDEIVGLYAQKHIKGIGFAVQGVVDMENGVSVRLPRVQGWDNVPLKSIVEERYGYPVMLMHDPACIMIAERAFGRSFADTLQNAVILRVDSGIGMCSLIDGRLYYGTNGKAGEIGHVTACEDGPVCACGKRGCLEEYVSGHGMIRRFAEQVNKGSETTVSFDGQGSVDEGVLAEAARSGDPLCLELFKQMGQHLGRAVSMVFNILNPEQLILYGYMIEYRDLFHEELTATIKRHTYEGIPTRLLYSSLGSNAVAQGAALAIADYMVDTMEPPQSRD